MFEKQLSKARDAITNVFPKNLLIFFDDRDALKVRTIRVIDMNFVSCDDKGIRTVFMMDDVPIVEVIF